MCIIYYATHAYCTHRHLLGAFACGVQSPVHRPHIFHLDDNGFLCDTCMLLGGAILNPDIDPVRYNPPSFDNGEPTEWDEEVQERNRQRRRADMKTIPDEWIKQQQGWDDWGRDTEEMEEEEEMSPGRAAHRELVKKQLSEMVLRQDFEKEMMEAEKPEGMNPNAAEFTADENLRF